MTGDCRDRLWSLTFLQISQGLREDLFSHDSLILLLYLLMTDFVVSVKKRCGCSAPLRWCAPSSRDLTVCGLTGRNLVPNLQYFAPGNRSHSSGTYRRTSVIMVPASAAPGCSASLPLPHSCSNSDRSTEAPLPTGTETATALHQQAYALVSPAVRPGRALAQHQPAWSHGPQGVRSKSLLPSP